VVYVDYYKRAVRRLQQVRVRVLDTLESPLSRVSLRLSVCEAIYTIYTYIHTYIIQLATCLLLLLLLLAKISNLDPHFPLLRCAAVHRRTQVMMQKIRISISIISAPCDNTMIDREPRNTHVHVTCYTLHLTSHGHIASFKDAVYYI